MSIFQILAVIFALCMIYMIRIHARKKVIHTNEALIWFGLWLGFILLALFPQVLTGIVGLLHFARVFDLLTVTAFMVLTIMVVSVYLKQKDYDRKLEILLRKLSINKPKRHD
jgi:hypothetical protein